MVFRLPMDSKPTNSKACPASAGSFRALFQKVPFTMGCSGHVYLSVGAGTELESVIMIKAIFLLGAIEVSK